MSSHPERIVVEPRAALAGAAADWIAAAIAAAVRERGRCTLALAGGSTPRAIHAQLAARTLPWERVQIYFGDERCVPPDDPGSNYRMALETLLRPARIAPERVHRIHGEERDRDAAARAYERELPERLDILLLGMGPDGHTASLFPGAPTLAERTRRVVPAEAPVAPHARITITPPVIAAARRTAVIAAGTEKAAAVARALEGSEDPRVLPVRLALGGTWFVDDEAAASLHRVPV